MIPSNELAEGRPDRAYPIGVPAATGREAHRPTVWGFNANAARILVGKIGLKGFDETRKRSIAALFSTKSTNGTALVGP